MKKIFMLIILPLVLLSACDKNDNPYSDKTNEQLTLTVENFHKYIAVYTISDTYYSGSATTIYRYRLEGSSHYLFEDCHISYVYTSKDGYPRSEKYEMDLTVSGCGESKEISVSRYGDNLNTALYFIEVVSASGNMYFVS